MAWDGLRPAQLQPEQTMAAYVIADIQVTDGAAYEQYRPLAGTSIARFGGRFIVRGGAVDLLEGEPHPERIVVIEFPDLETARRWYRSDEYQAALKLRQAASRGRVLWSKGPSPPLPPALRSATDASGSRPRRGPRSAPRHGAGSGSRRQHRARRV